MLPPRIEQKVAAIAASRQVSRDRALTDLLDDAITAYDDRRSKFLALAEQFEHSQDPAEAAHARTTFGS